MATPIAPVRPDTTPGTAPATLVIARALVTVQLVVGLAFSWYAGFFMIIAAAYVAGDDEPEPMSALVPVFAVPLGIITMTAMLLAGLLSLRAKRRGRATPLVVTEVVMFLALGGLLCVAGVDWELGALAGATVSALVAAVAVPLLITSPSARNWLAARR